MTDLPEKIWAARSPGVTWWQSRPHHQMTEYTRTDVALAMVAAEREACASQVSANCFSLPGGDASRSYNAGVRDAIEAIRAITPDDAVAALERVKREAKNEALREAAELAFEADDCYLARNAILALMEDTSDE